MINMKGTLDFMMECENRVEAEIVTKDQAIAKLRRLAERLVEEGEMLRGMTIHRSLEVLTGEDQPIRPMLNNKVVPFRRIKPDEPK